MQLGSFKIIITNNIIINDKKYILATSWTHILATSWTE